MPLTPHGRGRRVFACVLGVAIWQTCAAEAGSAQREASDALLSPVAVPALLAALLGSGWFLRRRLRHRVARAETTLRSLQLLVDASPLAVIAWSRSGGVLCWSDSAERMFGIARREVLGAPLPPPLAALDDLLRDLLEASESIVSLPLELPEEAGNSRHIAVSASRLTAAGGEDGAMIAIIEDAASRWHQERRLRDQVRAQRETLVREVHHRIKNHLQGVAGLLRQQLVDQPTLAPLLEAATTQVLAIAAVHGLQGEQSAATPNLRDMVSRIAASIGGMMHLSILAAESCVRLDGLRVVEEEAVPLAMVLNEILLNAAKHRASETSVSPVRIEAEREGGLVKIRVSNPGRLPPRFDYALGVDLGTGLALARSLLPQRGAALSLEDTGGMVVATLALSSPHVILTDGGNSAVGAST